MLAGDPQILRRVLLPPTPALPFPIENEAAVLLLIDTAAPEPRTYLTLRDKALPTHPGQVSLPGGRIETGDDSLEATALREASEEIALDPGAVTLLGRLPAVSVSSGVRITPVVGWSDARLSLRPAPGEVERILTCPLPALLDLDKYRRETHERFGQRREFWVLYHEGYRIWGATGNILHALAETLARNF